MAIVYRHIRLDKNEPFYIGIGENEERAYTKRSRNRHWKNIVKNTPYEVEILFRDMSWEEVCMKEIEFIKLYGRQDLGTGILCNMTNGGDRPPSAKGLIRSGDFKQKLSNSRKGIIFSEEHKKKMSQTRLGRTVSIETKNKLSEIRKGKKKTEEWKKKIAESNKGKVRSEEWIMNLKKNHKGNTGRTFSEEHKKRISEAIKKKYAENPNYNKPK